MLGMWSRAQGNASVHVRLVHAAVTDWLTENTLRVELASEALPPDGF